MPAGQKKAEPKKQQPKNGRRPYAARQGLAKMASHPPVKSTAVS